MKKNRDHELSLRYQALLAGVILICATCGTSTGQAQDAGTHSPRYRVVDLGAFMAREIDERPGLNQKEHVASWQVILQTHTKAALVDSQRSMLIGNPSQTGNSFAFGINDKDELAGILESPNDLRHTQAFYYKDGALQILPALGGRFAVAKSIANNGWIAGNAEIPDKHVHAATWLHGAVYDLGTLPGGDFSRAFEVNDSGDIAGESNTAPNGKTHAVLWTNGSVHDLGLLSGGSFSSALAVNHRRQAVGFADDAEGGSRAVLFSSGKVTDLGSLGDEPSSALSINDAEQIVGGSPVAEGKMRAFLWEKGHLVNLNKLVSQDSGWLLMTAYRINTDGSILAEGFYGGTTHLCLLIPTTKH